VINIGISVFFIPGAPVYGIISILINSVFLWLAWTNWTEAKTCVDKLDH
jgi:hypothetical protein